MKFFFSVLSLEGKNQRNFEKACDRKKAKVPKAQKHRNELAHLCVFLLSGQGTVGAAGLIILYNQSCIFCLAKFSRTHYPKVFGVQ